MTDPIHVLRDFVVDHEMWTRTEAQKALTQVQNLVRAAQTVSRTEATGVLPDFQPLADALAPFEDTP